MLILLSPFLSTLGSMFRSRAGLELEGVGKGSPWKESSVKDERMRFVIRLKDEESMASLCREFGISRKTGYKIFERCEQYGLDGLSDRTRRPFRHSNQLPEPVMAAKREKPQTLRGESNALRVPQISGVNVQELGCLIATVRRAFQFWMVIDVPACVTWPP
jgi:hypothetical protein